MSAHDMRDALDALSLNMAWKQMVGELRERQEAIIRSLVAETTPADERDHFATEYRMIETFIGWPDEYRQELNGAIEMGRE
jgi:hypothetical protein